MTAVALAGCTVNRAAIPTGGSKADGTVDLTYAFAALENPVVDWNAAQLQAEERCKAWGYSSAEKFGNYILDSLNGNT